MAKRNDDNLARFTGEEADITYTPPKDHLKPQKTVKKDISTLDAAREMVAKVAPDNADFAVKLGEIAHDLETKCFIGPLKTPERVAEKADDDYNGDITQVKDIVRGTILINNPAEFDNYISRIGKSYKIARVKNGLSAPSYQDANVNVELPSGCLGEIILISPEMLAAQISGDPETSYLSGYELYMALRVPTEKPEDVAELKQRLAQLYQDAIIKQEKRLAQLP